MRITKFGHACVRVEDTDVTVVIDPGCWTQPEAVRGATALLITHEHPDHWTAGLLRETDAPIHTIGAVADHLPDDLRERTTVVRPGEHLTWGGVGVEVVGEKHAVIHPELPHFDNSGYLLTVDDLTLFHPGDALTVPEQQVDLLFLPVSAPWLKASECIDYAREVGARRNVAIHDRIFSSDGLAVVEGHLERFLAARDQQYVRVADGEDVAV